MTAAPAVGMVSNPGSGHNRSQFERICARVQRSPGIHHCITQSADDIDTALAQLAEHRIEVLAINGGDGTSSALLGRLFETDFFSHPPLIALLPGGTANMNAGDIGVQGPLRKAVDRFCDWCDRGGERRTTQRSLLRVVPDGERAHYTMFLGGGAIIHGTEYAHREIHSRGLRDDFSLILGTLRTVWGVLRDDPQFNRHISVELALDDGPAQPFDTLILAVSTLQRLSFGMRPFWGDEPGQIRLTLMEQGCTRFARTFLSIIRGKPNQNAVPESGYRSHNCHRLGLALTGPLNLDGEILDCNGHLSITATPALEFLQL
ncbi:MAG: hypothetical protein Hals2KO_12140 [Halioglobus sp.]